MRQPSSNVGPRSVYLSDSLAGWRARHDFTLELGSGSARPLEAEPPPYVSIEFTPTGDVAYAEHYGRRWRWLSPCIAQVGRGGSL